MNDNLTLPTVMQRFHESATVLDDLSDRLRALSTHDEARESTFESLRDAAIRLAATAGDLGAASRGVTQLGADLAVATAQATARMDQADPTLVTRALDNQSARIEVVEHQLASLAASLATLAGTIGEQFADAQARAARSAAELDEVVMRMMTIPEKIRRKHGLA